LPKIKSIKIVMKSTNPENDDSLDIAVIGMSCRFPGANDIEAFWENLRQGIESITFFSREELIAAGIDPAFLDNPNYIPAAPIIDDEDCFDAAFFGYPPNEAEGIDPQHRVFMECAWGCFEHAGYNPHAYQGLVGIYAGAAMNTYSIFMELGSDVVTNYVAARVNSDKDFLTTRVSYKLDLKGPSIAVQTSCSTSLVAVHLACQSLLDGECDMALAGGVSIQVPYRTGYFYEPEGILSSDGHCRAFDEKADGTNFGNGVGVVLLKRLSDAINDNDTIHAVIKGTAINNDGASKVSYSAPSLSGQTGVIVEAMANAGVDPDSITYVEAHGTGTLLGDPIEVAALERAFRSGTDKRQFCALGSVKSNIGHLDTAAGIAGLIKTVLAIKHKQIPKHINFTAPNPGIDFENSPFYVNDQHREWETEDMPRRAGVTSLGVGGTNAHVIVEEAPALTKAVLPDHRWHLLTLSARTKEALSTMRQNLAAFLCRHQNTDLADAGYTLQVGRRLFPHRTHVVCNSTQLAIERLTDDQPNITRCDHHERPVVFMFPGQGTQYPGMAANLYAQHDEFRHQIDLLCGHLEKLVDVDIKSILLGTADPKSAEQLNETHLTQPALFIVEYALARTWISWGIHPEAMIGHSIGEYVCATIAGVMTVELALEIVVIRSRLMQKAPRGKMLFVSLSRQELEPYLNETLALAAVNGPTSCVASGPSDAIDGLAQQLQDASIVHQEVKTSHAFHSAMMDSVTAEFANELERFELLPAQLPFLSNITGTWITAAESADRDYWCRHLRHTVQFDEGLQTLFEDPNRVFLEVGPGQSLHQLIVRKPSDNETKIDSIASFRKPWSDRDEYAQMLEALGMLWAVGVDIDWNMVHGEGPYQRIPLPTYPFERKRFWKVTPQHIRRLSYASSPADTPVPPPNLETVSHTGKPTITTAEDWFYFPSWKRLPPKQARSSRPWVLFSEEAQGPGHALENWLREAGHTVITVQAGTCFNKGDMAITIAPDSEDDYRKLFTHIKNGNADFAPIVVHLWGQGEITNDMSEQDLPQTLVTGFHSLIKIAKAMFGTGIGSATICAVSVDACNVSGIEKVRPLNALMQGPCRVIPKEFPGIACKVVDLSSEELDTLDNTAMARLVDLFAGFAHHDLLALRNGHVWAPSYEKIEIDSHRDSGIQTGGVYLITGGFGGLGMFMAAFLTGDYDARVALVGRSPLPDRDQWDHWITTHGPDDSTSKRITALKAMASRGADVLALTADVTNAEEMLAIVRETEQKLGTINGVIHAAGVLDDGAMLLKSQQTLDAVLAPKVIGSIVLHDIFKEKQVDFILLMSSLASVLGRAGQVDHTAASCFQDAFAQTCAGTSPRILAVNWPAWRDIGVAATVDISPNDHDAINPDKGLRALQLVTSLDIPQILISPTPVHSLLGVVSCKSEDTTDTDSSSVDTAPESADVVGVVLTIWQQILGIDEVKEDDRFMDLGGDSLSAIRIVSQLIERFSIDLNIEDMLEAGTPVELAALIEQRKG
jgi:acyl transferase domain-containing protein/acyl carrier protein